MAAVSTSATGSSSGFIFEDRWNSGLVVIVAAENEPQDFMHDCRVEGFNPIFLALPIEVDGIKNPFYSSTRQYQEYTQTLNAMKEGLHYEQTYAVIGMFQSEPQIDAGFQEDSFFVAFGAAANVCLNHFVQLRRGDRLCALVAYYPTAVPDNTRDMFPSSTHVIIHVAGSSINILGLPKTKHIDPGVGTGERLNWAYPAYTYRAAPGFAEEERRQFDVASANLAWTRTLQALRKGFNKIFDEQFERLVDTYQEATFFSTDRAKEEDVIEHTRPETVSCVPTMSGGIGPKALRQFYSNYFVYPPGMELVLLSRTIGVDRVVDELYATFDHSTEIPWILPGVPPTNKHVKIMIVSIFTIRGDKLSSEHMYWDQASVLLQVGLLDPKLIPSTAIGVDHLPVLGGKAAKRIFNEDFQAQRRAKTKTLKEQKIWAHLVDDSFFETECVADQSVDVEMMLKNEDMEQSERTKSTSSLKAKEKARAVYIEEDDELWVQSMPDE
ncbi:hypothetical protein N7495_009907 [Penicillium taxi]|uniref:uncharacterized protein n=1 Tax=Penicillium taxi TaxID=168475 RepID=UPI0025451C32|nr:uncharacterized protein N7495_009907 [Penicillium taxi]KAJ5885397.1 hypothetical protein N7495_009907 [Penicillium taxi]